MAIKDLPKGWRKVRDALIETFEELNNGATSPSSIALEIARERLQYLGYSENVALELLEHDQHMRDCMTEWDTDTVFRSTLANPIGKS